MVTNSYRKVSFLSIQSVCLHDDDLCRRERKVAFFINTIFLLLILSQNQNVRSEESIINPCFWCRNLCPFCNFPDLNSDSHFRYHWVILFRETYKLCPKDSPLIPASVIFRLLNFVPILWAVLIVFFSGWFISFLSSMQGFFIRKHRTSIESQKSKVSTLENVHLTV